MMSNLDRLVYMANQIARNFVALGHERAIAATADHLASFWDPRMKRQIFALLADGGEGLGPVARAAAEQLRDHGAPPPQSPATTFGRVNETDRSDAG